MVPMLMAIADGMPLIMDSNEKNKPSKERVHMISLNEEKIICHERKYL